MDRSELLAALANGTLIVTGNARLAHSLLVEFERDMLNSGRTAWPTPAVLPLSAWLAECYEQAALCVDSALPRLLTTVQEEQVWASIIAEDGGLLRVAATARCARLSWRLLCYWQLPIGDPRFGDNENGAAFFNWAGRFRRHCSERGEVSESELPGQLAAILELGGLLLPQRILLAGFFEREPALEGLVSAVRKAGTEVDWVGLSGRPGSVKRLRADDRQHELRLAALWSRQLLEAEPGARIGIVIPDLAERRPSLSQLLAKTLNAELLRPGADQACRPWNVSLGRALSEEPIIATALRLLSLMKTPADTATLGTLLASPHWDLPSDPDERRAERARRALLDRQLRSVGDAEIRLRDLRFQAGRTDEHDAPESWSSPDLVRCLDRLLERLAELPGLSETAGWATVFTDWLKRAGWPRGRQLDSAEYQAVEAWNGLLSQFSGLSDFAGRMTRVAALTLLRRLASETLFQPRSGEVPVQVLGLYEANGLTFDHLWVMGLHGGAWPDVASPDPFLPLSLQRERGVPHCDPERERAWAKQMTADLASSAPSVIFSHPGREGTEELLCSPLIESFEPVDAAVFEAPAFDSWQQRIRRSATLEPVPPAGPLPFRLSRARGGSQLFRNQAACPFKAFAEHRLGARPLDRLQIGLGAMRRGSVLHDVMESLWRELQTRQALLAMATAEMRQLVRRTVAEVLEQERKRSPVMLSGRYAELEAARMEEKVLAWLELERQRSPFRVVGFEQWQEFGIGGLLVNLKLDRVDELEDGSTVVLDYKTGKVKPSGWFGERPDDPQLPLYGVAAGARSDSGPVSAVAFAQIRPEQQCFSGVVRDAGILPGLPAGRNAQLREASERWPAILGEWLSELERLAQAFRRGEAHVDPKDGLQTCDRVYCELAALCRVRERLSDSGEDGDENSGSGRQGAGEHSP